MELGIIYLFVFITGLCIGSFLNVVVLRTLSNESIAYPASKCPLCQTPLKWWHNIPVFSFLLLKGKCGFCKGKISPQYPIVELITALFFCGVFWKFQFSIPTIFMMVFTSIFVVIAVTDFKEKIVFDVHTITLIVLGLLYNLFDFSNLGVQVFDLGVLKLTIPISFINSILGALAGGVIMELLARSGYLFAKTRAFGEGDSYIASGLGAIFGVQQLLLILLYSVVIQLCYIIPLFFKKLYVSKDFKTIASLLLFLIVAAITKFSPLSSALNSLIIFLPFIIVFAGLGLYTCKRILAGIKTSDGMTYLPFGPAMVLSGVIFMFLT